MSGPAALATSLNRPGAASKPRSRAAKNPGWMTNPRRHHHRVPLERARELQARLACGRPPGLLARTALKHVRPVAAGNLGRRIGAAIGHDQHLVGRPAIGVDGLEAATYTGSSLWAGTRTRKRSSFELLGVGSGRKTRRGRAIPDGRRPPDRAVRPGARRSQSTSSPRHADQFAVEVVDLSRLQRYATEHLSAWSLNRDAKARAVPEVPVLPERGRRAVVEQHVAA